MTRPLSMSLTRGAAVLAVAALLSGCGTVIGSGFSGSGDGFGGFGARRAPPPDMDSYTMRRLTGREDEVAPLQIDTSVTWPRPEDEGRPSVFETDEERRAREAQPRQSRRGTAGESPELSLPREPDPRPIATPRALTPPPPEPLDRRGEAIPGAPAGTVTTGGSGRTGTFGGPAGSGTVIRDGGTTTLMGADGTIRTVPTPR